MVDFIRDPGMCVKLEAHELHTSAHKTKRRSGLASISYVSGLDVRRALFQWCAGTRLRLSSHLFGLCAFLLPDAWAELGLIDGAPARAQPLSFFTGNYAATMKASLSSGYYSVWVYGRVGVGEGL